MNITIGMRFGRLVVTGLPYKDQIYRVPVRCDCGKEKVVAKTSLLSNSTNSCGCLQAEGNRERGKHQGLSNTRLYKTWSDMLHRCNNPRCKSYGRYGAKGITVCEQWKSYLTFRAWALESGYDDKLTIDRIDNAKGYSPDNCRWATGREQLLNQARSKKYTAFGETKSLVQWTEDPRCHISTTTLADRIAAGLPTEIAITAKIGRGTPYSKWLDTN